jgi:hypothetical protein
MRDNWLSNRIFKSHEDIVYHCCDAGNKLVDQPWKIMSTGTRDWPKGRSQRVLVMGPAAPILARLAPRSMMIKGAFSAPDCCMARTNRAGSVL